MISQHQPKLRTFPNTPHDYVMICVGVDRHAKFHVNRSGTTDIDVRGGVDDYLWLKLFDRDIMINWLHTVKKQATHKREGSKLPSKLHINVHHFTACSTSQRVDKSSVFTSVSGKKRSSLPILAHNLNGIGMKWYWTARPGFDGIPHWKNKHEKYWNSRLWKRMA